MKKFVFMIILFLIVTGNVEAQRGCCSHHGGVAGCSSSGRQVCNDGTLSSSCTCTPSYTYGCTDPNANNYDSKANKDNGNCKYNGCRDKKAINYNSKANVSDGSCLYEKQQLETQSIPFIIQQQDVEISSQEESIIQEGKNGEKNVTYRIVYNELGKQVSKTAVKETITKSPIPQIIGISKKKTENNDSDSSTAILAAILFTGGTFYFVKRKNQKQKDNDNL